ncbi:MAG: hypothetical protein ACK40M_06715, partial [Flavobacteriales bacterium]
MKIILSYPLWYIVFCLLAGGLYAAILYFREKQLSELRPWLKTLIATTRFVVISLLSFFLLQPLIRTEKRRVEKPLIVIAQDNSGSVIIGKDSSFYKGVYLAEIDRLKSKLEENYDVRSY